MVVLGVSFESSGVEVKSFQSLLFQQIVLYFVVDQSLLLMLYHIIGKPTVIQFFDDETEILRM